MQNNPKPVNARNHSLDLFNPEIGTLIGATTPGQSGPESDAIKGYSAFSKVPVLLETRHQIV